MTREVAARSPPMRLRSSMSASGCRDNGKLMVLLLLGPIEGEVEGVEIPQASPRRLAEGTVQQQGHTLLREAAMGAERRIEAGEVVARRACADHRVALGDGDDIAE